MLNPYVKSLLFYQFFSIQYDNHVKVEEVKYRLIREQLIEKKATLPLNDTEGLGRHADSRILFNRIVPRD